MCSSGEPVSTGASARPEPIASGFPFLAQERIRRLREWRLTLLVRPQRLSHNPNSFPWRLRLRVRDFPSRWSLILRYLLLLTLKEPL